MEDDSRSEVKRKRVSKRKGDLPPCALRIGPSPADYKLAPLLGVKGHDVSKWRAPAFSIRGRWAPRCSDQSREVPGPKYDTRNISRFGKIHVPGVKIQESDGIGAQFAALKRPNPGPGQYSLDEKRERPSEKKGFTLKSRHYITDKGFTPGPNQYKIPDSIGYSVPHLPTGPAFSLCSRPYMRELQALPGPAAYRPIDASLYKKRPPTAVIPNKLHEVKIKESPGPTQYQVKYELTAPRAPSFRFGLKHSMCAGTYRTAVDDDL